MSVNNVGLKLSKVLFDLEITYAIIKRAYWAYEFINDYDLILLILRLLK
ncbi:hypothetical protein ES703_52431 [subsurface metagenome]